jgi:PAS domain-containing protein
MRNTVDGTILDCNNAMAHMVGYDSFEELKTHLMSELYFDVRGRFQRR